MRPLNLVGLALLLLTLQNTTLASTQPDPLNDSGKRTATTTLPAKTRNAWSLPPFSLQGLDGKQHSLSEWKGQVIMLNFWASWCAPCQYEIRDFVRYQEQYATKGLQIIGLGIDEERKLQNASRSLSVNYPVLIADPANSDALLTEWGNPQRIVPYTVIIDRNGEITYIHRGQLDQETFNEFVLPLI
ncbi:TlpA family protein disulfide reductase [Sedimenticola sp.]|uniref:TlpA family protein disulfide reductase n=1 Tax=Sedimenticola sp. TaxID=1940285 RepID=UPI003D0AE89E